MRELADAGAAILFYSTDYDELVGCCDRVLILYDGRIVRVLEGERDHGARHRGQRLEHHHARRRGRGMSRLGGAARPQSRA